MEFAFVALPFFMVLIGIIEAGRFIYYYEILSDATRQGARYAIVNGANSLSCPTGPNPGGWECDPNGDDVVDRVRKSALGISGTAIAVTPTWSPDNARGSTVTVEASYNYTFLIPFILLPVITVEAESSLVINN